MAETGKYKTRQTPDKRAPYIRHITTSGENMRRLRQGREDNDVRIDPETGDVIESDGTRWAPSPGIGLPEERVQPRQSSSRTKHEYRAIVPASLYQRHEHQ